MSLVIDAALVVAALQGSGATGAWAEAMLLEDGLAAPHLMPVEVTDVLRRSAAAGRLSTDRAGLAHADLLRLSVELFPFEPLGQRVWELRDNVTAYDAWYVALAESLQAPLATLDLRLTRAAGPTCAFRTPPSEP